MADYTQGEMRAAIIAALKAEVQRQCGVSPDSVERLDHMGAEFKEEQAADALLPLIVASPSRKHITYEQNGGIHLLDAMYVARDLLPMLRALKAEDRASVLDYLDAEPRGVPET